MGTNSPGGRIERGQHVVDASVSVDVSKVKARLAAFLAQQKKYVAADKGVKAATAALEGGQANVGARDAVQDRAVDVLAAALAGDGLPRANPFKPFGAPPPSALKTIEATDEAKACAALAGAVSASKAAGPASKAAAKALAAAADAVTAASKKVPPLRAAQKSAMTKRDALAGGWEKAYASLKLAAKLDGDAELVAALFDAGKRAAKSAPIDAPTDPNAPAAAPLATAKRKRRR